MPIGFHVRAPHPHEYEAVARLASAVFSGKQTQQTQSRLQRWAQRRQAPGFALAQLRVGCLDDRIVSMARVTQHTLRYGKASLRVAGIGDVCTHPKFRKRGYSEAVMHDALTYVAERGAHLALLRDTSHYYARYGFYPIWPDYWLIFKAGDAAALIPQLTLRPIDAADSVAIADLYEKHWSGRVAFVRNDSALWQWRIQHANGLVALTPQGQLVGYLWQDLLRPEQVELVCDAAQAAQAFFAYTGRQYPAKTGLRWPVPPDDAVVAYMRNQISLQLSVHYRPEAGWMGRFIQARAVIEALLPELRQQMHSVSPNQATQPLDLQISVDPDKIHLHISTQAKATHHLALSHAQFMQLLFGSLRPATLALQMPLDETETALLEAIFPARMAALGAWDWF
jgi:predicted N-acetyltransferase YhbS